MTPQLNEESRSYLLGFSAAASFKEVHGLECIGYAWDELWDNTMLIFRSLGNLTQGKGTESLSGPVGIYKMTDQIVSYGWMPYIALCALISLNVGIFNLLPLPALDGGRIFILLFEKLFRKKMPRKAFEWAILGSYVLLFGLLIFATWNDIVNFFL
ncbi:site-2 protease family protein [Allobaculum sp. Allo2]|nr:site-2 protease family protein [Allobaculum sp. Allo2]